MQDDRDDNIYYMPREEYESDEAYAQAVNTELELYEYYQEKTFSRCLNKRVGRF